MTDDSLLVRAREGDPTAFLVLYERHCDPIFRFCRRMLGSTATAEDVTHDCFVAIMTQPLRFDPARASLRTYLCAIARNLSLRRLQAEGRVVAEEEGDEPTVERQVLDELLEDEMAQAVQSAIAALPALQREVVILVEYEERSLAEAAEIVGAEIGTVKARLHRAREGLRKKLASLGRATFGKPMDAGGRP